MGPLPEIGLIGLDCSVLIQNVTAVENHCASFSFLAQLSPPRPLARAQRECVRLESLIILVHQVPEEGGVGSLGRQGGGLPPLSRSSGLTSCALSKQTLLMG